MQKKVKATKTVNPLHFEDLDPHRFEDLVRRLLYSFREWSEIEPTGRSGSDDGFDVRAWEKAESVTNVDEEGEEGSHSLDGHLWQIQGKREKTITPSRMRKLIREGVDGTKPPYGYILAAATNISKAGYDVFRTELRKKGVAEFHFWGKDHLEDQLALPQNDEILFTFFGISLSPRRRSRIAEVKFAINNKNKILKLIFGRDGVQRHEGVPQGKSFVLRDIKADRYPYQDDYPDFKKNRRWEEHDAAEVTPTGVFFKFRERYAYLDQTKKEWDFSPAIDLTPRVHNIDESNEARLREDGKQAVRYWRHLPRAFQAKLQGYGFVPFEDMLIIDDKGDPEYSDPHILIDFGTNGPFKYTVGNLVQRGTVLNDHDIAKLKRIRLFPSSFPSTPIGTIHKASALGPNTENDLKYLRGYSTLYLLGAHAKRLAVGDIIQIPGEERLGERTAEVTHKHEQTVAAIIKGQGEHMRQKLQTVAGREISDKDKVTMFELYEVYLFDGKFGAYAHDEYDRN